MADTPEPGAGEITLLLQELYGRGDDVLPEVMSRLYGDLRRMAASCLQRERVSHTLQPTALLHEAYLRLTTQDRVRWRNRSHFIGVTACLMRRILVDHARASQANKRGGGDVRMTLDPALASESAHTDVALLDLDRALARLAGLDERQAQVVDLRYFGGLSIEETAEALALSPATVKREWQMARAWLVRELRGRSA